MLPLTSSKPLTDPHEIEAAFQAPFTRDAIKFKPQAVSGNRAMAVPYVDARVVMDRLDTVVGCTNWNDSYRELASGSVVCQLAVCIEGKWISKEDVGSPSEQPDEGDRVKAAFSDALKRAAVKWGIARYLYRSTPQWVDYDPKKRQFITQPKLPDNGAVHPANKEQKPAPTGGGTSATLSGKITEGQAKLLDSILVQMGKGPRFLMEASDKIPLDTPLTDFPAKSFKGAYAWLMKEATSMGLKITT